MRYHYKYGSWVVYRIPFIQQYMYFWTQMLENENMLGMPISKDDMLTTVNIKDVLDCVTIAALSKKSMIWSYREPQRHLEASTILPGSHNGDTSSSSDENNQQATAIKHVYELISEPLSLVMMADVMSRALREAGSGFDVDAAVISDEQLVSYLKLVSKPSSFNVEELKSTLNNVTKIKDDVQNISRDIDDFADRPLSFLQGNSFIDGILFKNREHQDSPDLYPCPDATLTPFCIQLILNHLKVSRNNMPPIVPNNDVRDITGRVPIPIDIFFMLNRKLFRPE